MAKRIVRNSTLDDTTPVQSSSLKLPRVNLNNIKNFQPKSYMPIMVVLLVVASFLIGVLFTKVDNLEKGNSNSNNAAYLQNGGTVPGNNGNNAAAPAAPAPGTKVNVDAGKLPLLGNKDAKVTVIEFADFQCPFCEQWFTQVGKSLQKDYVDTGKVKFAFRNFAFLGQESNWSAEAALCANDQNKFWEFHDYLYEHQGSENSGAFSKDNLKGFAVALGLNASQFNSCLDNGTHTKDVADDKAAGDKAGVTGTPTVFVNGISLVGAQPYDSLKTQIDKELSK